MIAALRATIVFIFLPLCCYSVLPFFIRICQHSFVSVSSCESAAAVDDDERQEGNIFLRMRARRPAGRKEYKIDLALAHQCKKTARRMLITSLAGCRIFVDGVDSFNSCISICLSISSSRVWPDPVVD